MLWFRLKPKEMSAPRDVSVSMEIPKKESSICCSKRRGEVS